MEDNKPIFIIDSNSLITPYKLYYSFDLAPKFWNDIEQKIVDGSIVILDKVYDELLAGDDELSTWLSSIPDLSKLSHKDQSIVLAYGEVLNYIQTSGLYTQNALIEWSGNRIADPWIIASAKIHAQTVVTFEASSGVISEKSPSSKPKIPDICKHFNVGYTNLFDMMRKLSINIS